MRTHKDNPILAAAFTAGVLLLRSEKEDDAASVKASIGSQYDDLIKGLQANGFSDPEVLQWMDDVTSEVSKTPTVEEQTMTDVVKSAIVQGEANKVFVEVVAPALMTVVDVPSTYPSTPPPVVTTIPEVNPLDGLNLSDVAVMPDSDVVLFPLDSKNPEHIAYAQTRLKEDSGACLYCILESGPGRIGCVHNNPHCAAYGRANNQPQPDAIANYNRHNSGIRVSEHPSTVHTPAPMFSKEVATKEVEKDAPHHNLETPETVKRFLRPEFQPKPAALTGEVLPPAPIAKKD